jgi:hypothetical protein
VSFSIPCIIAPPVPMIRGFNRLSRRGILSTTSPDFRLPPNVVGQPWTQIQCTFPSTMHASACNITGYNWNSTTTTTVPGCKAWHSPPEWGRTKSGIYFHLGFKWWEKNLGKMPNFTTEMAC